jgi:hypothetical protein
MFSDFCREASAQKLSIMSHYSLPTPSAAATGKMTMGPGFRDEDEPRVCGQHIQGLPWAFKEKQRKYTQAPCFKERCVRRCHTQA